MSIRALSTTPTPTSPPRNTHLSDCLSIRLFTHIEGRVASTYRLYVSVPL